MQYEPRVTRGPATKRKQADGASAAVTVARPRQAVVFEVRMARLPLRRPRHSAKIAGERTHHRVGGERGFGYVLDLQDDLALEPELGGL